MKSKLARVLIEKGVIQKGTILEAYHSARGLSGQYDAAIPASFKLIGAQAVGEWVYFNAIGPDDEQCRIRCDYIIALDSMPINRVIESLQLTENGDDVAPRRNRRRNKDPAAT
jgi:hypothetical protein